MWQSGEFLQLSLNVIDPFYFFGRLLHLVNWRFNFEKITRRQCVASLFFFFLFLFLFYSKLFPSLIHRHPNGNCANFLLAHSREAILFPFIISPILCLPTYFVFKVRETLEVDTREHEAMYHVYFDKDSMLYR